MVARSGVLRSDTIPKTLLRVVVGDDGGTGAEFTERHIFRMLYLGWWLGTMAERSGVYGATYIPNALLRVVVGDDGGTERSLRSDIHSEYST